MEVIELAKEAQGQKLIDIIRETAVEQGFNFYEPDKRVQKYAVSRRFPEFDPFHGTAFDTIPSLTLGLEDLRPEGTYQRLQCETKVSTFMIGNSVKLDGEYAKYRPYFEEFVEGINSKLVQDS